MFCSAAISGAAISGAAGAGGGTVGAANLEKDWQHVVGKKESVNCRVKNISNDVALLAVQGPKSEELVQGLTQTKLGDVAYYHFAVGEVAGIECFIARTGYTGEDGFELFFRAKHALRQHLSRSGFGKESLLTGLGLFGILTHSTKATVTACSVEAASLDVGATATLAGSLGTRLGVAVVTAASAILAGLTSQHLIVSLVVIVVVLTGIGIANLLVALD